ncbi:MAG: hypothetical protein HYZ81_08200 [Nitrospinae bacterium]|nr:hypothetical protein [Nitrospinota bacterium]
MARTAQSKKTETVLDQKLRELTVLAQELIPDARVEMSFERYEDGDAHLRIHPPPDLSPDEVQKIELTLGQRCTEILVETGLFIVGAVYD